MNILSFPIEIQEKILSYLKISDLMKAVKTCSLWRAICNDRLVKRWCLENISPDVLCEMTQYKLLKLLSHNAGGVCTLVIDWIRLCKTWSKTIDTEATIRGFTQDNEVIVTDVMTVTTCCVCMAVSGSYVIVGDQYNNLIWYDVNGEKVAEKSNFGEPVLAIGLLKLTDRDEIHLNPEKPTPRTHILKHDAVIVISTEFLVIYSMPTWRCKELYFLNEKHIAKSVSVQGDRFAYHNCFHNVMTICSITAQSPLGDLDKYQDFEWDVLVEVLCRVPTNCLVQNWKLWKNTLICLLQNGTVMTWSTDDGTTISESVIISDFLYPFESYLYRGLIFCNISIARALLNYWHVNMGTPHWLVSADGMTFIRMNSYYGQLRDEINTINIKRSLIVAGTRRGRICIYRHKGSDHDIPKIITEAPMVTYKITHGPIYKCDFDLSGKDFLLYVKTMANTVLFMRIPVTEQY